MIQAHPRLGYNMNNNNIALGILMKVPGLQNEQKSIILKFRH